MFKNIINFTEKQLFNSNSSFNQKLRNGQHKSESHGKEYDFLKSCVKAKADNITKIVGIITEVSCAIGGLSLVCNTVISTVCKTVQFLINIL